MGGCGPPLGVCSTASTGRSGPCLYGRSGRARAREFRDGNPPSRRGATQRRSRPPGESAMASNQGLRCVARSHRMPATCERAPGRPARSPPDSESCARRVSHRARRTGENDRAATHRPRPFRHPRAHSAPSSCGHALQLRSGRRRCAEIAPPPSVQRHPARPDFPDRHGPRRVSYSARPVRDCPQGTEPMVVSPRLRLGKGHGPHPTGPREPARNALDGSVATGSRHSRNARCRFGRLLPLAWVHSDVRSPCRVVVQAREDRHPRRDRRGVSAASPSG